MVSLLRVAKDFPAEQPAACDMKGMRWGEGGYGYGAGGDQMFAAGVIKVGKLLARERQRREHALCSPLSVHRIGVPKSRIIASSR